MPSCVTANGVLIVAVPDLHVGCVRPRSDQRHVPADDVQELRKLVETELAQGAPDRRYSGIVDGGRLLGPDVASVRVHRAEFQDLDQLIVEADPRLNEEYRAWAG